MSTLHSGVAVLRFRGAKLVGVLNRPAGTERKRCPAVLFLHGFPGAEKNVDIQRRLLELGVGSLSLHFSGAWGSEGQYRFSTLVPQARAGLAYLARQEFVDRRRLAAFGFSMGGWTALNLAASAASLRAVAAVSPVGGPEMITDRTHDFIKHLSRSLHVKSTPALTEDFKRAVSAHDPAKAAAKRRCPLLMIHGDADDVVPAAVSHRIFSRAARPKKLVLAGGAGHDFLDRRPWLTEEVAQWLSRKLRS
jgi:uncharacterized protein